MKYIECIFDFDACSWVSVKIKNNWDDLPEDIQKYVISSGYDTLSLSNYTGFIDKYLTDELSDDIPIIPPDRTLSRQMTVSKLNRLSIYYIDINKLNSIIIEPTQLSKLKSTIRDYQLKSILT